MFAPLGRNLQSSRWMVGVANEEEGLNNLWFRIPTTIAGLIETGRRNDGKGQGWAEGQRAEGRNQRLTSSEILSCEAEAQTFTPSKQR